MSPFALFAALFVCTIVSAAASAVRPMDGDRADAVPPGARIRYYDFTITKEILAPDGVAREMTVVNGQFPGPMIRVTEGEWISVAVHNGLDEPTTIHWHGILQHNTPWMDGVPAVTQCPIPPGGNFTYTFSTEGQSGSYWYHGHYASQYVDGLVGALIIDALDEVYKPLYDDEYVVILSDQYHSTTKELVPWFLSPASEGNEPTPDIPTINGRSIYNCSAPSGAGVVCSSKASMAHFEFVPGRRYRLRIISVAAFANFFFSIDGHQMTLIEADGTMMWTHTVGAISVNVGQRYSVIVQAHLPVGKNPSTRNYWMRAEFDLACFTSDNPNMQAEARAVIAYRGAGTALPTSSHVHMDLPPAVDLDPRDLVNLYPQSAWAPVVRTLHLEIEFYPENVTSPDGGDWEVTLGHWNHQSYTPVRNASTPILHQVNAARNGVVSFPPENNGYTLESGVQEMIITNTDGGEHPLHLHMHTVQVLGWGNENEFTEDLRSGLNYENPLRRDIFTVPANGWVVVRFIVSTPTVAMFHCHIQWHAASGLTLNFVERPSALAALPISDANLNLCRNTPTGEPSD